MTEAIDTEESSKTKAVISSIRHQAGYPTSTQNTRCSPAGTYHSLVYNKQNRCLCNWSYFFYLLSFLKETNLFDYHPRSHPHIIFRWACKLWNHFPSVSLQSLKARATAKQMLLQGSKKSDQGWRGELISLNNFALLLLNVDFIFTALLNRGILLKAVFAII